MTEMKSYLISILLQDESGSLSRVLGAFWSRGVNIDSLSVSKIDSDYFVSRVIIKCDLDKSLADRIVNIVEKEIPVYHTDINHIDSEEVIDLSLVMYKAKNNKRFDEFYDQHKASLSLSILFKSEDIIIFSYCADYHEVDKFYMEIRQSVDIISQSKSGVIGLNNKNGANIEEKYVYGDK